MSYGEAKALARRINEHGHFIAQHQITAYPGPGYEVRVKHVHAGAHVQWQYLTTMEQWSELATQHAGKYDPSTGIWACMPEGSN